MAVFSAVRLLPTQARETSPSVSPLTLEAPKLPSTRALVHVAAA